MILLNIQRCYISKLALKVIGNIQFLCNTFLKTEREISYTALRAYNQRYQCGV